MAFDRIHGAALAALISLSSCAPVTMPDAASGPPSSQDCYYVIGVSPLSARVGIIGGTIKDGVFATDINWIDHWYAPDADGYLVVKTQGGETQGINELVLSASTSAVIGQNYLPREETLVFEAPVGKVVYITNVSYTAAASGNPYQTALMPRYHQDIEGARAFMKKHYPLLANQMEQGTFHVMPYK